MNYLSFSKVKRWKPQSAFNLQKNYETEYEIIVHEKGQQWKKVLNCGRRDLEDIKAQLEEILDSDTTAEKLNLSEEKGVIVDKHYQTDELCKECKYKLTSFCSICLFTLDSPLERKLFVALHQEGIYFTPQYPLDWNGKKASQDDSSKTGFSNLLTKVDFFIEKNGTRLCVYTDGHTYHERTEEQATRDKNIDRKLQDFGFKVLRYTGKEINEQLPKVVSEIKGWVSKASYNKSW